MNGDLQGYSRGRTLIGVTLIVALLASAALQQTAYSYRSNALSAHRPKGVPAPSRVANLDSFSLALLLGGLRGPLVMFLWTSSESQKGEKDLESFDTKVEMIRLLQPEFVTVHLFQIWNKIYNVSAQKGSPANKYVTILDGIEYAKRVLDVLPNDINIVSTIGSAFADKLGGSSEKTYYWSRVRNETLPVYEIILPPARLDELKKAIDAAGVDQASVRINDAPGGMKRALVNKLPGDQVLALFKNPVSANAVPRQSLRVESRSGRRNEMDTLVDVKGMLLPEFITPTVVLPPGVVDNDGSELQFLKEFQPFPFGVSPIALGYNYNKRAQLLQRIGLQKHVQMSRTVVDHQPALNLNKWAEEERDRARRLEQRALPSVPNADNLPVELRTSKIGPDAKVTDRPAIDQAIFSYLRANKLALAAKTELDDHKIRFPDNMLTLGSHLDTTKAILHLMEADAKFLEALIETKPEARKADLEQAKANYAEASRWAHLVLLKYYVDPADAAALNYQRTQKLEELPLVELEKLLARVNALMKVKYKKYNPSAQEFQEYGEYIQRANDRLERLK